VDDLVEQLDDVAVGVDGVRHGDVAVEQVANRLRDDGLAVARGPIHEQRVPAVHGRAKLVEHALAQDQLAKRVLHALSRGRLRRGCGIGAHVRVIRRQRHWCSAHVLILIEAQQRPRSPGIREAINERRTAGETASSHLHQIAGLQMLQHGFDHRVLHTQPGGEPAAALFAGEMQGFQNERQNQIER
jgi:hypothetical protein